MRLTHLVTLLVYFSHVTWCQAPASSPAANFEAIVTTELGSFRFEFARDKAPQHVQQFMKLTQQGYYDGSAFHRVVANSLIQGGDPLLKDPKTPKDLWGSGGMNVLPAEVSDLKHERGIVSSVRSYRPKEQGNVDGTQFFVCILPQPALDGVFSTFGRVTQGMEVVERISQVPTAGHGQAVKPVRILKITIQTKEKATAAP
jgi:cyclophilin family peptidyl-prolyl cis-trans isomerase